MRFPPQYTLATMKSPLKQCLVWTPRILGMLFAVFLSLFALDVFGEGHGFWKTILALLIHLVPTGLVLIALAIAWRWEWLGGLLFIGLGALYLVMAAGRFHWSAYVVIAGPLFLVGVLFLVNWRFEATLRSG